MVMICDSIPKGKVQEADAFCASVGFNLSLADAIAKVDFDPDESLRAINGLIDARDAIVDGRPDDCVALLGAAGVEWTGPARESACAEVECQRSFWDHVADFLLWLAENLLQLIDYVLDLVRVIVAWITWLALAITAVLLVVAIVIGMFTGGVGAALATFFAAPAFALLGKIGALGAVASFVLKLLDSGIEWLQVVIRDARARICGEGLPSLPDWDPSGPWFPPAWPGSSS